MKGKGSAVIHRKKNDLLSLKCLVFCVVGPLA